MGLGSSITIPDASAANQVFTRSVYDGSLTLYVNDTKRASGHREDVQFRTKRFTQNVGTSGILMVQSNIRIERQLSTDLVPYRMNITVSMPKSLQDAITTIRLLQKDANAYWAWICNSDAKVDDINAGRAHIP